MSVILLVGSVVTGAILVLTGAFSLAALVWGDLLDSGSPDHRPSRMR